MADPVISIPSDLHDYVYKAVFERVLDNLRCDVNVDPEDYLDDCIICACQWFPEHTLGCKDLDNQVSMEEVVDAIRKDCPDAVIWKTGLNSYRIKLSKTYWTLYRVVNPGWSETTKMRFAFKVYSHRDFVPNTHSIATIKRIDSLVPEFKKMVQDMIMEGNREVLISLIQETAKKARRKKKTSS